MNLNTEALSVHKEKNLVRFPNEIYEWNFDMSMDDFDKITNQVVEDKAKLVRVISLKYSSLDGGKIYNYNLEQSFISSADEWETIEETTD